MRSIVKYSDDSESQYGVPFVQALAKDVLEYMTKSKSNFLSNLRMVLYSR